MIGVRTQGRLGNQMFQYAFGYSSAQRMKTSFFIDYPNSDNYKLNQYFQLRYLEEKRNEFNKVIYNRFINTKNQVKQLIERGDDDIQYIFSQLRPTIYQQGYFQSALYFEGYENQIKKLFRIKPHFKESFFQKYKSIFSQGKPIIVAHFRGGDYFNWLPFGSKSIPVLPFEYYDLCFSKIKNINNYQIVWVSDSIDYVKKYYENKENFYYSNDNEINDFQFLINADKLIISNSSFAWWGGYLNKNNAEVFAPKYWLLFKEKKERPIGICSMNWEWVDIT